MRLFISYSRDDKAWVYELEDELRDAGYDVWIDKNLVGGLSWWEGILEGIESADMVLAVLSPRAVGSIYCAAELDYALDLNKPIVPLMLKKAEYPPRLNAKQIQFIDVESLPSLERALLKLERSFGDIREARARGKFAPPSVLPGRPDLPRPQTVPESVFDVFAAAEEAVNAGQLAKAEELFNKVIADKLHPLAQAAAQRLTEVKVQNERVTAYLPLIKLASNPGTAAGARAAWQAYVAKYGRDYDPQNLASRLDPLAPPPTTPQSAADLLRSGDAKAAAGDLSGAVSDYGAALKLDGRNAELYVRRGMARERQGDEVGAFDDYDAAVRHDGAHGEALARRGRLRARGGDFDNAITDFAAALALKPPFADALLWRGRARLERAQVVKGGGLAQQFAAAEQEADTLRAAYQQGRLKQDAFLETVRGMMVLDDQGVWWMMGVESGVWYRHDNVSDRWSQQTPPGAGYDRQLLQQAKADLEAYLGGGGAETAQTQQALAEINRLMKGK